MSLKFFLSVYLYFYNVKYCQFSLINLDVRYFALRLQVFYCFMVLCSSVLVVRGMTGVKSDPMIEMLNELQLLKSLQTPYPSPSCWGLRHLGLYLSVFHAPAFLKRVSEDPWGIMGEVKQLHLLRTWTTNCMYSLFCFSTFDLYPGILP